ncbi:hypothetical protein AB5I41_14390 [Sphingomonas sp. MMS24-JH45]
MAQTLSIGVATLYRYVEDRDHLVRLVADRLARRNIVENVGQGWDDALREHAAKTYAMYRAWPHLLTHCRLGVLGSAADTEHSDAVLTIMLAQGVAPAAALALYFRANQAVIGAAVGAAYHDRLCKAAGGEVALARETGAPAARSAAIRPCPPH